MSRLDRCASYDDFRRVAKQRLPAVLFDYIDGGSYSEATLERNVEAFRNLHLQQRILIDVSNVSSSIKLFGEEMPAPIILGPVGFSGMYARRGEVQAAKAAREAGLPFCLSTVGLCSVEEVAQDAGQAPWFQLYMIKDREWMASILQRASAAGCKVLVLTGDLQTPGSRYRDVRSGMMRRPTMVDWIARSFEGLKKMSWTWDVYLLGRPHNFGNLADVIPAAASFNDAWEWIGDNFDPSVTWDDLSFIRQHWTGPIVLKGIMNSQDAQLALDHNLDGIVVSNHGGRQLDGSPSTVEVIPEIMGTVGDQMPVLIDSGIRSGLDVLKAMNLGASACLIGRPWAMALAAGGRAGVERMLLIMLNELHTAQVLSAKHAFG